MDLVWRTDDSAVDPLRFVDEAYDLVQPMVERVIKNNGFCEWYSVRNQPKGSGTYRGEAGVLYKTIGMFGEWARNQ